MYDIGIKNTILDMKHFQKMGIAVWLYMWLIDKETRNGKILGGKPIVYKNVIGNDGKQLFTRRTYMRYLKALLAGGYIKTIRTPRGLAIIITKDKKRIKFHKLIKTACQDQCARSGTSDMPEVAHRYDKSGTSNIRHNNDTTVRQESPTGDSPKKSMKSYKEPVIELDSTGEPIPLKETLKIGETMKAIIKGYNERVWKERGTEKIDYVGAKGRVMLATILKKRSPKEVVEILEYHIYESKKFDKHPQMSAALSENTIMHYKEK